MLQLIGCVVLFFSVYYLKTPKFLIKNNVGTFAVGVILFKDAFHNFITSVIKAISHEGHCTHHYGQ